MATLIKQQKKGSIVNPKRTKGKTVDINQSADLCFVIMPFGGWYDEYYQIVFTPAIKSCKLKAVRTDDFYQSTNIVQDIWKYTNKAKVVLADLTNKNPNVLYELGIAHALKKPTILISENLSDIPFDLRSMRVITYDKNLPDWGIALKKDIKNAIEETIISPLESVPFQFLEQEKKTKRKSKNGKNIYEIKQENEMLKRVLYRNQNFEYKNSNPIISQNEARNIILDLLMSGLSEKEIYNIMLGQYHVPRGFINDQLNLARNTYNKNRNYRI